MQKRVTILMGSPRQAGNTALLAKAFQEGASQAGHAVRLVDLGALTIAPCLACDVCLENGGRCVIDDDMQPVHDLVVASDVLAFATPLYYSTYSGQMKCCLDRLRQREKNSVYQAGGAAGGQRGKRPRGHRTHRGNPRRRCQRSWLGESWRDRGAGRVGCGRCCGAPGARAGKADGSGALKETSCARRIAGRLTREKSTFCAVRPSAKE